MIEINLLPGKKKAAPAGAGFKLGLKLPDFRAIIANITNPWLLAASGEINIIRGIDADRYIWPHVLDQITKALPPYTWLTTVAVASAGGNVAPGTPGSSASPAGGAAAVDSLGVTQVRIWITGITVDIQAYTTFLRQLAASPWLTDVTPATSSTIIEADRPVTAFNVAVRYRVADSVYIRTVPFTQPVR